MKVDVLRNLNEIAALQNRWALLDQQHPFRSYEWYFSWFEHCAAGSTPFVLTGRSGAGRVEMIAPFYSTSTRLGGRKMCLAADGHVCTDYGQIVCPDTRFESSISNLMCWLSNDSTELHHAYCEFDGLGRDSLSTRTTLNELKHAGFEPEIFPLDNCWEVELPESWEELNSRFSKKHRRKTKKAASNLEQCRVSSSIDADFDDLWTEFVRLHQLRREQVGDAGCFAESEFERFLKSAAKGLIHRNLADLYVIEFAGQPVAATLVFFSPAKTFMYQTGFDPEFSKLEPGYMLIVESLRRAIQRGHGSFDFMRGNEPYKQRWNAQPVPMIKLRFRVNDSFRNQMEDRLRWSRDIVKSSLKKLRLQTTLSGAAK